MRRLVLYFAPIAILLLMWSCVDDNIVLIDDVNTEDEWAFDSTDYSTVVSVVFSESGAVVDGQDDSILVSISGNNGVTVTNISSRKVQYRLSGNSSNGYFKLYSGRKQAIVINSLTLTNTAGAAINIQGPMASPSSGKSTQLVVWGSNSLADGVQYSQTPQSEDEKAVLFSEGQLIFSGRGSLSVTATGKAGITSDDYVKMKDSVNISVITTSGHGVRGKDSVIVQGGVLGITSSAAGKKGISTDGNCRVSGGATTIYVSGNTVVSSGDTSRVDGIKADGAFLIDGGTLMITSTGTGAKGISVDGNATFNGGEVIVTVSGSNYGSGGGSGWGWGGHGNTTSGVYTKGIKADGDIVFNGGTITVSSTNHEAIESKAEMIFNGGMVYAYSRGDDAINASSDMTFNSGYVCGYGAGTSTGADGIDANGNIYINGGGVYGICTHGSPDVGFDANSEERKKLYVRGGVVIAIGGLENGAQLDQPCYKAASFSPNATYALTVGDAKYVFQTPTGGNSLVVSGGSSQPTLVYQPTTSGGSDILNGMITVGAEVSGGTSVSLSSYSGGGSRPGGH